MGLVSQLAYNPSAMGLLAFILALLGSTALFIVLVGIFYYPKGKPKQAGQTIRSLRQVQLQGIQARLDHAQILVSSVEYVKRSLILGIPLGIVLYLLVGSVILTGVGIVAGFIITWTRLEQERDIKVVRYNKQLASACDTIRTAYGVNPSLKKAMETVAAFSQSPLREDFQELLVATSQERFAQGLQEIAERRRSIVFDTVATSLMRANEATGEVDEMLRRLAESTRQNVAAFEEALTSQINARSNIQWGTYGPWVIFGGFRLATFLLSLGIQNNLFEPMNTFFSTLGGNVVVLMAALISIYLYRYCQGLAQRGLVVRRVKMTQAILRRGQRTLENVEAHDLLSGQSHGAAIN